MLKTIGQKIVTWLSSGWEAVVRSRMEDAKNRMKFYGIEFDENDNIIDKWKD